MTEIDPEGKIHRSILQFINHNNSDAKYDKSIGCFEEFTPKQQSFTVMLFIKGATSLQSSTSSAILNLIRLTVVCEMKWSETKRNGTKRNENV